jgi:hypothetical protein
LDLLGWLTVIAITVGLTAVAAIVWLGGDCPYGDNKVVALAVLMIFVLDTLGLRKLFMIVSRVSRFIVPSAAVFTIAGHG